MSNQSDSNLIASAAPLDEPKTEHGHQVPTSETEINPKIASDIAYWSKEFGVSGDLLHEAIRTHGNHVVKIRAALGKHEVNLT
jgi:hypothetical protein